MEEEFRPCELGLPGRRVIPPLQGQLAQQCARTNAERPCKLLDHGRCRVASPPLYVADIGSMDVGAIGVVLLAPAPLFSEASYILAEANAYIHARIMTPM